VSERVTIDALAYGGDGVGTLADGRKVFVPMTAPGDVVDLTTVEAKPQHARARMEHVITASPDRVVPACPYYERCGGCQLQHLSVEAERSAKDRAFYEALARLGGVERGAIRDARSIAPSPLEYGYRTRVRLHVEGPRVGYRGRRSREMVEIDACPLLDPTLDGVAQDIARRVRMRSMPALEGLDVCVGSDSRAAAALRFANEVPAATGSVVNSWLREIPHLAGIVLVSKRALVEVGNPVVSRPAPHAPGTKLFARPDVFAQANAAANDRLVGAAIEGLSLRGDERAIELYSGAGNFGLCLSWRVSSLLAVEEVTAALALARRSITESPPPARVRFVAGDAVAVCRGLVAEGTRVDVAVLDPPRTGAKELPGLLAALRPDRVAYVSCDPTTLGRDVKALRALGYRVTRAEPVDMFPRTYHVEGVVHLCRA